jgi:hypothetical protein
MKAYQPALPLAHLDNLLGRLAPRAVVGQDHYIGPGVGDLGHAGADRPVARGGGSGRGFRVGGFGGWRFGARTDLLRAEEEEKPREEALCAPLSPPPCFLDPPISPIMSSCLHLPPPPPPRPPPPAPLTCPPPPGTQTPCRCSWHCPAAPTASRREPRACRPHPQ